MHSSDTKLDTEKSILNNLLYGAVRYKFISLMLL